MVIILKAIMFLIAEFMVLVTAKQSKIFGYNNHILYMHPKQKEINPATKVQLSISYITLEESKIM